ncbi:MAG TPA: hypothetical protein VF615_26745 [Longimicrobiaceae bacterium]|jgi:hypothetical protein
MTLREIEAEALKLPEQERALLAERLLASLREPAGPVADDPIWGLGTAPVVSGVSNGSVEHDRHLYDGEPLPGTA